MVDYMDFEVKRFYEDLVHVKSINSARAIIEDFIAREQEIRDEQRRLGAVPNLKAMMTPEFSDAFSLEYFFTCEAEHQFSFAPAISHDDQLAEIRLPLVRLISLGAGKIPVGGELNIELCRAAIKFLNDYPGLIPPSRSNRSEREFRADLFRFVARKDIFEYDDDRLSAIENHRTGMRGICNRVQYYLGAISFLTAEQMAGAMPITTKQLIAFYRDLHREYNDSITNPQEIPNIWDMKDYIVKTLPTLSEVEQTKWIMQYGGYPIFYEYLDMCLKDPVGVLLAQEILDQVKAKVNEETPLHMVGL